MTGVCGGEKMALEPLELDLEIVVNGLVGPGNQNPILCKNHRVLRNTEPCLWPVYQLI